MLNKITVKDLKLGPISSTVSPDFITLKDFKQEQKVNVTFKGKTEEWSLYAFITDKVVFTNSADGWTNVAWLYGEGQEDVVNGFEIREAFIRRMDKGRSGYRCTEWSKFSMFVFRI